MATESTAETPIPVVPPSQDDKSIAGLSRRIQVQSRQLAEKDSEIAALKAEFDKLQWSPDQQPRPSVENLTATVEDVESKRDQVGRIRELEQKLERAEAIARYRDPAVTALLDAGVSPDKITDEFLAAIRQGAGTTEDDAFEVPYRFSRGIGPGNESLEQLTRNFRPGDYNPLFDGTR